MHDRGRRVSPRGRLTHELDDVTVTIKDPLRATPNAVRPRFSELIAATELVQLLAGVSCLPQLDAASKGNFSQFSDDGRLLGAYGPRLYDQLPEVERRLRDDPDTRQAIATLWRPYEPVTRDVPCTLSLTFRIRDGKLGLKVHMRSNDAWLGLPYDWFVFSRVQLAMAEVLGLPVGPYIHHVDSLHLYENDFNDAWKAVDASRLVYAADRDRHLPAYSYRNLHLTDVIPGTNRFVSWIDIQQHAWWTLTQRPISMDTWFDGRIAPLPDGATICIECRYVTPVEEISAYIGNGDVCVECS